jgi:protein-S-isoprenylcysteine O-methyltransferase Ste14
MENQQEEKKIELSPEALKNLNATWKWTMFLSVLGYIFLGLLIIGGVATSTFLTAFRTSESNLGIPESLLTAGIIVAAIIYFLPIFFLFRFSRNTRDAIHERDSRKLDKALRNLRIYFTFLGILVIFILSVYFVALFAAGASMSFLKGA